MNRETKKFLRDLERVSALGELFTPKRRQRNPGRDVLKEIRPGVFVSVEPPPPEDAPSPFQRAREALESLDRAEKLAGDIGREIRRRVR